MILTLPTFIFHVTVFLSVCAPLIPAWAHLKQFSCPSAPGLWWQLLACEVPVRGLHYALLKKTLFDLTRFYFEGPSLKNSHRWPLTAPSTPFPPSSPHNPRPKKGEKYVDFIFTWLHGAHAGRESVLTLCEVQLLEHTENQHKPGWTFQAKWFLRACTRVILEGWDYLW